MKLSSQLTLLSSSLLLASFGLQAEIIQVTESVSSVVYQGQQSIKEAAPSATKPVAETPTIVAIKPVTDSTVQAASKPESLPVEPVILPLPVKITPAVNAAIDAPVAPIQPLSALAATKPATIPTVMHETMPTVMHSTVPSVMPTTLPVHPVLNTSALSVPADIPANNDVDEEPSLFSAISNWFSVKPVKPWQKGTLAKKAMKPGGEVPEFDVFSEKVFAYKQGSIGGNGVGGGGCGCN